jgi:hypothetical protein
MLNSMNRTEIKFLITEILQWHNRLWNGIKVKSIAKTLVITWTEGEIYIPKIFSYILFFISNYFNYNSVFIKNIISSKN